MRSLALSDLPDGFLDFWCPFDAEVCPEADTLSAGTRAWAQQFDLGDGDPAKTELYANVGAVFTANVYPHITGPVGQALTDYSAWGWVANDHALPPQGARTCDVLHKLYRWARIMRAPSSFPELTTPADAALTEVFTRLYEEAPARPRARLVDSQVRWLLDMGWEVVLHERGAQLTVNDYLAMRLGSGGAEAALGYVEIVEGIEVPDREWTAPRFRAASEAGMFAAVLDNDRYSLSNDLTNGLTKYTIFNALLTEYPNLTATEALLAGVEIRNRMLNLYIQLRAQILSGASSELRRYLTGLDLIVSGNIVFGATALRYHTPQLADAPQRHETPTSPPGGDRLPYPTISWWWDHLT
ncbi:hypothetical protein [Nocardia sp. NPDC052566]|uniref:terpene synthase family protein n=1 Tax=Nocardia sp. NPDC052566 TaxID=3364330 RepID=UPI0037C6AC05